MRFGGWLGLPAIFLFGGCAGSVGFERTRGEMLPGPGAVLPLVQCTEKGSVCGFGHVDWNRPDSLVLFSPATTRTLSESELWRIPSWQWGGGLSWLPWTGVVIHPEGEFGMNPSGPVWSASLGVSGIAKADPWRWSLGTRLGWISSHASSILRRTRWIRESDSLVVGDSWTGTWNAPVPWIQGRGMLEVAVARSSWTPWTEIRYTLQGHRVVAGQEDAWPAVRALQVLQWSAGFHRSIGERWIATGGIRQNVVFPTWKGEHASSTAFLLQVQWRMRQAAPRLVEGPGEGS